MLMEMEDLVDKNCLCSTPNQWVLSRLNKKSIGLWIRLILIRMALLTILSL